MKPFFLKIIKAANGRLEKVIKASEVQPVENTEVTAFHSLSPISNADASHYTNALQWALDNSKKETIYNIALTGPYGSGKSSILQTFKANNTNPEYEFLEISLATFKEETEDDDKQEEELDGEKLNGDVPPVKVGEKAKKVKKNEDILRLIELSILPTDFLSRSG